MRRGAIILLAAVIILATSSLGAKEKPTLLIGAAASLQVLEEELREYWANSFPDIEIEIVFAGSGQLAQQAALGAPYDLLLLADEWLFRQERLSELLEGEPVPFAQNRVALAQRADHELGVFQYFGEILEAEKRIALPNPELAPAGLEALQIVFSNDSRIIVPEFWQELLPAEHVKNFIETENEAQASAYLLQGEVDFAFIYVSTIEVSKKSKLQFLEVTSMVSNLNIVYAGALLANGGTVRQLYAAKLLNSLLSRRARKIFEENGFHFANNTNYPNRAGIANSNNQGFERSVKGNKKNRLNLAPFIVSLGIGVAAAIVLVFIGTPLAWLLARLKPGALSHLSNLLLLLPLILPPSVLGFLGLWLLGREGAIGSFLANAVGWSPIFTWWGALLASVIVGLPLFVKPLQAALESIPELYREEAQLLGLSRWESFRTVELPLAWHGLVGGLALGVARALGEFGATLMLAGNIPGKTQTLPLAIYGSAILGDWNTALYYSAGLLLIAIVLLSVASLFLRNSNSTE